MRFPEADAVRHLDIYIYIGHFYVFIKLPYCPVLGIFFGKEKGAAFWANWIVFKWQVWIYGSIPRITNPLTFTPANQTNGKSASFFVHVNAAIWFSM